jgi:hypothetical protein
MSLAAGAAHPEGVAVAGGDAPAAVASPESPGRTTGEMSRFRSLPTRPEPSVDPPTPERLPPQPRAEPSAAAPQRLGARPISRTAEMPELAGRVAPTLPTPDRPPPLEAKRGGFGRKLLVGLLCAGALAGAGVGVLWLLVEAGIVQIHSDPGPPPPMPKPAPGYKPPASPRPADKP